MELELRYHAEKINEFTNRIKLLEYSIKNKSDKSLSNRIVIISIITTISIILSVLKFII